jgi:hypothetical protein
MKFSLFKGLWTCRKIDYATNEYVLHNSAPENLPLYTSAAIKPHQINITVQPYVCLRNGFSNYEVVKILAKVSRPVLVQLMRQAYATSYDENTVYGLLTSNLLRLRNNQGINKH